MGFRAWARGALELLSGERERSISIVGERAYVEYRHVPKARLPLFSQAVSERARAHPSIVRTRINPFTHRVLFRIKGPSLSKALLSALVEEAERDLSLEPVRESSDHDRVLPDDAQLDRAYVIEAIADAAALFSGLSLRVVPFVPRRLGTNLHGLLFVVGNTPSLRKPLDDRLGKERAEFVLHLATAMAQALSQRPLSSMVDLSAKLVSLRELRERRALWERWSEQLTSHDEHFELLDLPPERPRELPKGPIERHAERAWVLAMGTFGVSLVTTRSPSRAIAAGFAALPQPARLGRELFGAELGRVLARHGVLVLSPASLRRLDRVDCLVIPASMVSREQFFVGDVFVLRGVSRTQALAQAKRLFTADRPLRVQRGDGYTLGPVRLLPHRTDSELEVTMAEREARGALVLALARNDRVVALVEVQISKASGVVEALASARKLGMQVVLASDDVGAVEGLHPDDVIGERRGLSDGIRRLQIEGRTVCFVGRGPSDGYAAADVGVALCERERPTPWGAHLLCPDDTSILTTIVEACSVARKVSEQSVRVGMGAAALGTLASAGGRSGLAARRVMFVVNAASLTTMLNAARRTASVERTTRPPIDPTPWHALEARGVLARLGTSEEGLPELPPREKTRNVLDRSTWLELGRAVQKELMSPLSPLLALGAGVSAMVGSTADAGIVAGVGGINALVGGYQRFRTERAITSLIQVAESKVHVRRGGRVSSCSTNDLRRGDIVLLAQGDLVPADCRILEAESLEVDTSGLTGESLPVLKGSSPCFAENIADVTSMLYAGNTIAAGRATAVVVATGEDTVAQRAAMATPDEARGGVEARLRELMRLTGPVAMAAGAALVTAGLLRGRRVDDLVSTGVGLAVAAVPEGLPVLATAAQLSAAERLSRRGALVKNPRAIEALGRVDVLCMDKTGTLTEGRIELSSVHDGELAEPIEGLSGTRREILLSAARAVAHARGISVDPMDHAIAYAAKHVLAVDLHAGFTRLAEHSFESGRSFEAVLGRSDDGVHIYVKGSPEQLISRSSEAMVGARRIPIGKARLQLQQELERLASRGLRVIAVAERVVSEAELEASSPKALLTDPGELCFRGLVAFRDPVRSSTRFALEGLAKAGVRVVMITGDHPSTAHHIAHEVGLKGAANVLHGSQIAQMTEAQLEYAVQRSSVFARVTPAQKVRIVRALQRAGHVVGMVGDGANDAPAMRIADAGIAVGRTCTEAARGAADIVLADARVDALVEAVIEGRAMWTAVRDAVSILVGGNLGEIAFTVAVGGLTGRPPLSPRQLLLVNFLTDIAPSMAIALRPPSVEDLSTLRDAGPETSLGAPLNREIVARAIVTALGAGGAWSVGRVTGGRVRARTIGLIGLVGSQLGQTLLKGNHSRSVTWTSVGSFAALGLIVQTPGLSQLFGCTPLGPIGWSTAIMSATSATLISPLVDKVVVQAAEIAHAARREPQHPPVATMFPHASDENVIPIGAAATRLLRN